MRRMLVVGRASIFAVMLAISGQPVAEASDDERLAAANELLSIIDSVLDNHLSPPTKQEMLLRGCRAIVAQDDFELQASLSRDVSDLRDADEMKHFLAKHLPPVDHSSFAKIRQSFVAGTLTAIPGGVRYSKAKDYAVEQQLRENRYVGIGIALAKQGAHPSMARVITGGPAYVAGGKDGDLMVSIDGEDATQYSLQQVVEILRGQEGKPVSIVVRQPDSEEKRTLNIVRGEVPFGSVEGARRDSDDKWIYRVAEESDIAYVKLTAIRGSSARELKEAANALRAEGCRALVLDLQPTDTQGDLRHAAMIADELLGDAKIGTAVVGGKVQEFISSPDQLFAGWPIVVLVGQQTQGQAEWIAAALQDNDRATVVGQATRGAGFVERSIELDNGDVISLRGGFLKRIDGHTLVSRSQQIYLPTGPRVRVSPQREATRDGRPPDWRGLKPDVVARPSEAVKQAMAILERQIK